MGDTSEQLRLLPEGADQCLATLHRAQSATGVMLELGEILSAEVGHRMRLQVCPDVLNRIELRGVRRQVLECDRSALGLNVLANEAGAVSLQTIPDDQELLPNGLRERFEELHHLRRLDRAGEESEVEPHEARPGDDRELLPTEGVLKNRSL